MRIFGGERIMNLKEYLSRCRARAEEALIANPFERMEKVCANDVPALIEIVEVLIGALEMQASEHHMRCDGVMVPTANSWLAQKALADAEGKVGHLWMLKS
jgi:hypothetical protein